VIAGRRARRSSALIAAQARPGWKQVSEDERNITIATITEEPVKRRSVPANEAA